MYPFVMGISILKSIEGEVPFESCIDYETLRETLSKEIIPSLVVTSYAIFFATFTSFVAISNSASP